MTRYARASWRIAGSASSLSLLFGTLLAVLTLALAGCAAPSKVTPSGAVAAAYQSLQTVNRSVAQALDRGRITAAQGERALVESRKVRQMIDQADTALALCGDKTPCDSATQILERVQPLLLELERKLREEEAKKEPKP